MALSFRRNNILGIRSGLSEKSDCQGRHADRLKRLYYYTTVPLADIVIGIQQHWSNEIYGKTLIKLYIIAYNKDETVLNHQNLTAPSLTYSRGWIVLYFA